MSELRNYLVELSDGHIVVGHWTNCNPPGSRHDWWCQEENVYGPKGKVGRTVRELGLTAKEANTRLWKATLRFW